VARSSQEQKEENLKADSFENVYDYDISE